MMASSNDNNATDPTWEPSFEISHISKTNLDEEEDVLSVSSTSSYSSQQLDQPRSSFCSHHSTYTCYTEPSLPWYNMNRRTMTTTLIMVSLTTMMFVYLESFQFKSLHSSSIIAGSQNWVAVPSQGGENIDPRPTERALVHPHPQNNNEPNTILQTPSNNLDAPPPQQQDPSSYLPPPSLSQADIEMLNTPLAPDMTPSLSGFADAWDPVNALTPPENRDVPIFWHIPKSGGSTIKDVLADCHGKVVANENGVQEGHDQDTELQIINVHGNGAEKFVNVDTTTQEGLQRAINLGLIQSNLAEVIITPFLYEAEPLFHTNEESSPSPRGRLFTTFRHPLERAVSLYNYLQYATWESTYNDQVKDMSLEEYASSEFIEDNWMTRRLAGLPDDSTDPITGHHLLLAMDVLRRKFLVGLTHRMEDSVDRFEKYFQWKYTLNPTQQETCRESLVNGILGSNTNQKDVVVPAEGTLEYNLILEKNLFDVELYKYAELLFEEQAAFVEGYPDGFRLVDARCSKCEEEEEVDREQSQLVGGLGGQEALNRNLRG